MSQETVDNFKRAIEAYNRRDYESVIEGLHPDVEFRGVMPIMLGGEETVYRGHDGFREFGRELDSAFAEVVVTISEVRDLGERLVGIGRIRATGIESQIGVESPYGAFVELKDRKVLRFYDYLDPEKAIEVAGLRE